MKDRIVDLLMEGIKPTIVAETVGCEPSYVSQVAAEPEIAERLQVARAARAAKMVKHDNTINEIEDMALDKIKRMLPLQTDIMKVGRIFELVNKARRAAEHTGLQEQVVDDVLVIELPSAAKVHFKLTADKQMVEVEGRSMVPLPSSQVTAMLRHKQANRLLDVTDVPSKMVSDRTRSMVDKL